MASDYNKKTKNINAHTDAGSARMKKQMNERPLCSLRVVTNESRFVSAVLFFSLFFLPDRVLFFIFHRPRLVWIFSVAMCVCMCACIYYIHMYAYMCNVKINVQCSYVINAVWFVLSHFHIGASIFIVFFFSVLFISLHCFFTLFFI